METFLTSEHPIDHCLMKNHQVVVCHFARWSVTVTTPPSMWFLMHT